MSHASDERFQELAMKLVSFECSAEEKAELRRIIDQEPARREELQKLCLSVGISRELLPLANALEATEGRMSQRELESFKTALARRREEKRRASGAAAAGNSGDGSQGPTVIDAEVVPARPLNAYKLGFYVLLLLLLIVGCVLLLKSCGVPKQDPGVATGTSGKASAASGNANTSDATDSTPAQPTPSTTLASGSRPAEDPPVTKSSASASKSKLKNYRGSQWKKLADRNTAPGSLLFYRSFIGYDQFGPVIEGLLGANGGVPTKFMLFTRRGNSWNARSFPNVDSEPQRVIALDASRTLITSQALNRVGSLIENGVSQDIALPSEINCLGAHADSKGRIFIHGHNGNVFVVSGGSVTMLPPNDPSSYVQENGNPTGMRRGFVRFVAKTDTGETMGIHYPEPASLGRGALVRFTGDAWEMVCSLGSKYPGKATHFLSRDSMVAALSREFLIVKAGVPMSPANPAEFEGMRSATWMAVRAASTGEFVGVDTYGAVYRYSEGQFEQAVAPIPSFQGAGNSGFRSVMIAPDGVIYGIHGLNQWSQSVLYQLVPQ